MFRRISTYLGWSQEPCALTKPPTSSSSLHRQQVYVLRKLLRKLHAIICAVNTPGFKVTVHCCQDVVLFGDNDEYDEDHKFIEQAEAAIASGNGLVWCDLVCEATQPVMTLQKAPLVGLYTLASSAFMEAARRMTDRRQKAEAEGSDDDVWALTYRMVVMSSSDDPGTRDWTDCTWTTASASSK
jgi:hypothetical protein